MQKPLQVNGEVILQERNKSKKYRTESSVHHVMIKDIKIVPRTRFPIASIVAVIETDQACP